MERRTVGGTCGPLQAGCAATTPARLQSTRSIQPRCRRACDAACGTHGRHVGHLRNGPILSPSRHSRWPCVWGSCSPPAWLQSPPSRRRLHTDVNQLLRGGQLAEALAKADRTSPTSPRDPQMRFLKGVIQPKPGAGDDAIATFARLTEDYPELPEPYNNLAVLYAAQGQFDKARAALEMAIRANPTYATAHENLGDVYARLAASPIAKALQLDAGNRTAAPKLALLDGDPARARAGRRVGTGAARVPPTPPRRRGTPLPRKESMTHHAQQEHGDRERHSSTSPRGAAPAARRARSPALARHRPGGRRRTGQGQVRHHGRRLRGRGLSRQGAQDRRELPAVRQGQALRRHDLPPRDRQLHGAGRRLRRQLRARRRPARRWRTKAARRWPRAARRTWSARWRWRAPTTRNSATSQFFINVKDNAFLDPTVIPPGDPVPKFEYQGRVYENMPRAQL